MVIKAITEEIAKHIVGIGQDDIKGIDPFLYQVWS